MFHFFKISTNPESEVKIAKIFKMPRYRYNTVSCFKEECNSKDDGLCAVHVNFNVHLESDLLKNLTFIIVCKRTKIKTNRNKWSFTVDARGNPAVAASIGK